MEEPDLAARQRLWDAASPADRQETRDLLAALADSQLQQQQLRQALSETGSRDAAASTVPPRPGVSRTPSTVRHDVAQAKLAELIDRYEHRTGSSWSGDLEVPDAIVSNLAAELQARPLDRVHVYSCVCRFYACMSVGPRTERCEPHLFDSWTLSSGDSLLSLHASRATTFVARERDGA